MKKTYTFNTQLENVGLRVNIYAYNLAEAKRIFFKEYCEIIEVN